MTRPKSWEEAMAEARAEGRREGLAEGRAERWVQYVFTMLCMRCISVPEAARERIRIERDIHRLRLWLERAVHASTIGDVFDDPR